MINGLAANRYIGTSPQYGFFDKQSLVPDDVTAIFDLEFNVASASSIIVIYGGAILEPEIDYTVITSGTQISFTVIPASGSSLYILFLGQVLMLPTAASYVAGSINPVDINANFSKSLVRNQQVAANSNINSQFIYYVNTTAGAITLTLPGAPVFGDKIVIIDLNRTFSTNPCTLSRNGKNINSVAANYVARVTSSKITLEFINNTIGWRLTLDTYQNSQDARIFFLGS